ncbi:MAG: sigma-E factor negative regulatory protein [Rhodocyclaceae bacterium]
MVKDQLSAWIDGELDPEEAARMQATIMRQGDQRTTCEAYWLIGDVLRDEAALSSDFTRRVMAAIDDEPTVLAPMPVRVPTQRATPRWMPMAAAVAGVAVVGWMSMSINQPTQTLPVGTTVAQGNAGTVPVTAKTVSSVRGGYDDDRAYMMAHQNYGVGSAMPTMAGYIRTVGDEQVDTSR